VSAPELLKPLFIPENQIRVLVFICRSGGYFFMGNPIAFIASWQQKSEKI